MAADRKPSARLHFSDEEPAVSTGSIPPQAGGRGLSSPQAQPDEPSGHSMVEPALRAPPRSTRSRLHFAQDELVNPATAKATQLADQAAAKLDKAKARIPKKKAMSIARETDEATGKMLTRLRFDEKPKHAPAAHAFRVAGLPNSEVHRQISKVEDENVGTAAAHHGEEALESTGKWAAHSYRAQKLKPYRQLEKAERRLDKANLRVLQSRSLFPAIPFLAGGRSRPSKKRMQPPRLQAARPQHKALRIQTLRNESSGE